MGSVYTTALEKKAASMERVAKSRPDFKAAANKKTLTEAEIEALGSRLCTTKQR